MRNSTVLLSSAVLAFNILAARAIWTSRGLVCQLIYSVQILGDAPRARRGGRWAVRRGQQGRGKKSTRVRG